MQSNLVLVSRAELDNHFNKTELVNETIQQIRKDFELANISITYSGNSLNAYTEIHQQLINCIDKLIRNAYSTLISILYRIDLSEEQLKACEKANPNYNAVEAMAHCIIIRELKKVLSRKYP